MDYRIAEMYGLLRQVGVEPKCIPSAFEDVLKYDSRKGFGRMLNGVRTVKSGLVEELGLTGEEFLYSLNKAHGGKVVAHALYVINDQKIFDFIEVMGKAVRQAHRGELEVLRGMSDEAIGRDCCFKRADSF